jgi:murein DD-endopeptidase MepM/ murein hydrolase activator NlpD
MRNLTLALAGGLLAAVLIPATTLAAWPVESHTSYISQRASHHHPAIDIAARAGTRIVPVRAGRVIFAGWKSNCGGRQVWISNGHGMYTAYYHLSSIRVHRGQRVNLSTVIGRVGRTGCATGPHLHVEVWHGRPWARGSYRVNPFRYIDNGRYLPTRYRR